MSLRPSKGNSHRFPILPSDGRSSIILLYLKSSEFSDVISQTLGGT